MQIGVIGLGRMGGNITRRLMENGHEAVVYDREERGMHYVDVGTSGGVLSAMRKGFGAHVEPKDHKAEP
jgi:6-phosphogluconate dehydrogenase (decarboxylating)